MRNSLSQKLLKKAGEVLTFPVCNRCYLKFFSVERSNGKDNPVFIIGAPRTGSTILYQVLTNNYEVGYIDNLASYFYRCLPLGVWLSNKIFSNKTHNNFKSDHGNTHKFGLHAPSECGQFWYRWLPTSRHFIEHDELPEEKTKQIQSEIQSCLAIVRKPFLFKNLNAGQRLRLINKLFPNAKIIYIRRNPIFTVKSILKAREKVGKGQGQWWSIKPRQFESLLKHSELEMCSAQVTLLERQIEQDLPLFNLSNVFNVHYDELSAEKVAEIADWLKIKKRKGLNVPHFTKDNLAKLGNDEVTEIKQAVDKWAIEINKYDQ